MSRFAALASMLACGAMEVSRAHADGEDRVAPVDRKVHVPIAAGLGLAYWLGEGPLKPPLSADDCRWCSPVLGDGRVRDALVWDDTSLARNLSNVTGYGGAAVWALGGIGLAAALDDRGTANWLDDSIIIAESAAVSGFVNYAIKAVVARERPFVHVLAPEDKPLTHRPQDNNQSFFSGHSALSMTLAVSAGTVAEMRGYSFAPYLYAGGITLSLATGYLRVAGDKHWATDVVTGWVFGAAIGYAVPRLLHTRSPGRDLTPLVGPSTVGIALRW